MPCWKGEGAIPFIAFPLRLENGFLRRTDEAEAVLRFIEMMARTPAGSWAGCPSFGVRNFFENMRLRPEGLRLAEKAINDTLADLGIRHYRLKSIQKEAGPNPDVDVYSLTLVSTEDPSMTWTSRLGG
ncbi:MAG: hypothetical protein KatS3mg005_0472 [Bryobacteraceae bacterium]|nr:MAG: hypothetical protein KatS3mg005_0472 [Bryobacteraceae bacterium]